MIPTRVIQNTFACRQLFFTGHNFSKDVPEEATDGHVEDWLDAAVEHHQAVGHRGHPAPLAGHEHVGGAEGVSTDAN